MARFTFLGLQPLPFVESAPPLKRVNLFLKDGTVESHDAPDQDTGFEIGEDLGFDIPDDDQHARALRCMRVDTRYEEIA